MEKHVEAHDLHVGDKILETWIGAEVREDGTQYAQFRVRRPAHSLPRYGRIARKYFRMNPHRLWWFGHVVDHVRLSQEDKRSECYLKKEEKCYFCE
ncbi:hypothetical protein ACFYP4_02410 [Streptomyces sp. NPDC005551]|uniref:hypothetical protein n=1 Tax=Streptomyces sp. NPDC005551 TaxID=3364725 RepID=UPI0036C5E5EA